MYNPVTAGGKAGGKVEMSHWIFTRDFHQSKAAHNTPVTCEDS
jgi:hypothetical protein